MKPIDDHIIKFGLAKIFVSAMTNAGKGTDDPDFLALWAVFVTGVSAGASLRDAAPHGQIERALIKMMTDTGFKPVKLNIGEQPPPHE